MREIKLRAWTGYSMVIPDYIDNESGRAAYKGYDGIETEEKEVLMQYTGLKDKNGKEIYEGDIVIDDWYPTDPHPTELPLDGKYKIVYLTPEWCCESVNDAFEVYDVDDFGEMKVIGNIYENPELLKEKK